MTNNTNTNETFIYYLDAARHFGIDRVDFKKQARRMKFDIHARYMMSDWATVAAKFGK